MFAAIARFDVRCPVAMLDRVVWVAGVIAGVRLLPSLASVTQSGNSQFLSSSAPSVRASMLAAPSRERRTRRPPRSLSPAGPPDRSPAADQAAIGRAEQAARQVPGVVPGPRRGTIA